MRDSTLLNLGRLCVIYSKANELEHKPATNANPMGTTTFGKPRCSDCGRELEEPTNLPADQRQPCPTCGSSSRIQSVTINETLELHDSLTAKGRHEGQKRPFIEVFSGADFSHRLKKWMQKLRLIDRDKDIYHEEVTDPDTGEVVHKTKEKLTEHTGHGSAKN